MFFLVGIMGPRDMVDADRAHTELYYKDGNCTRTIFFMKDEKARIDGRHVVISLYALPKR